MARRRGVRGCARRSPFSHSEGLHRNRRRRGRHTGDAFLLCVPHGARRSRRGLGLHGEPRTQRATSRPRRRPHGDATRRRRGLRGRRCPSRRPDRSSGPRRPGATVESETELVSESLFTIGISLCGSGEADIGVKLVGAVRRMYHEYGVVEWAIERAVRGRIEKSRGRLWATRAMRPRFAAARPCLERRRSSSR